MSEFDILESPNVENQETEPPQVQLTPEERHEMILGKMKLKNKILRYIDLFPHILGNFTYRIQDLDQMEIPDLEHLLEELEIAVNTRNSAGLTKMVYFESARIVENVGPIFGLQIANLTEALKQNQGVHDVLNELSLKYENDFYTDPLARLGYLTATTILSLHKLNSTSTVIKDFLSKKIPDNVVKEYEDL